MESRDSRREVSKQINCFDFQLECLQSSKNISLYRYLGVTVRSKMIDGYDEMVHRGPFQKYRSRPIVMDGPDAVV